MKRLALIAILALIFVGGRIAYRHFAHASRDIKVTSDPAALAAARSAWESEHERQVAELLANPASFYPEFDEQAALIATDRARIVTGFGELRADASAAPDRRVAAGVALRLLGEPGSIDDLVALAGDDPRARELLLQRVIDPLRDDEPIPSSLHPLILPALEDAQRGPRLAHLAARHRMLEAADTITRLALRPSPQGVKWLGAAALLQPTPKLVDRAVELLGTGRPLGSQPGLQALVNAAVSTNDPALRQRALDAVVAHLKAHEDAPWLDGATMAAVEAIEQWKTPEAAAMLSDLAINAKWQHLRKLALESLEKVDAARAADVAKDAGLDLGEDEEKEDPASGMTGAQAAEIAVRHGLLQASAAQAAVAAMTAEPSASDDAWPGARGFLSAAGVYASFDVETGTSPNRHDLLVLDLAKISRGAFRPEAVLETYEVEGEDAETGVYAVQFIDAGRLYEFAPEDLGDWYDVDAVVTSLNRALADSGRVERYVFLQPDGQIAEVVFGDPARVAAAAPALGLAVSDDPSGATTLGKGFENEVFEQLR